MEGRKWLCIDSGQNTVKKWPNNPRARIQLGRPHLCPTKCCRMERILWRPSSTWPTQGAQESPSQANQLAGLPCSLLTCQLHLMSPFSSVQLFSQPNSLWPHGLQHARPPCPSPSPGACPSSCPLSQWCRPAISSPDALCPQSFPASGTSPMSWLFTSVSQSVKSLRSVRLFATPWIAARQASLSITNSRSSPKLMSIKSVMPSSHLILCRPLLLLPPIPPSIRVFSNESTLRMRWPKYWSFGFNISPSNEYSGLISFRMDWLVPLAVQGTLKSLLQHHSSKASIFRQSAFFTVQLSHPYMTTGKTTPQRTKIVELQV